MTILITILSVCAVILTLCTAFCTYLLWIISYRVDETTGVEYVPDLNEMERYEMVEGIMPYQTIQRTDTIQPPHEFVQKQIDDYDESVEFVTDYEEKQMETNRRGY